MVVSSLPSQLIIVIDFEPLNFFEFFGAEVARKFNKMRLANISLLLGGNTVVVQPILIEYFAILLEHAQESCRGNIQVGLAL